MEPFSFIESRLKEFTCNKLHCMKKVDRTYGRNKYTLYALTNPQGLIKRHPHLRPFYLPTQTKTLPSTLGETPCQSPTLAATGPKVPIFWFYVNPPMSQIYPHNVAPNLGKALSKKKKSLGSRKGSPDCFANDRFFFSFRLLLLPVARGLTRRVRVGDSWAIGRETQRTCMNQNRGNGLANAPARYAAARTFYSSRTLRRELFVPRTWVPCDGSLEDPESRQDLALRGSSSR